MAPPDTTDLARAPTSPAPPHSPQLFIDGSAYPHIHDNLARDVRGDVDRVFASFYPLVTGKDVCFELGRALMGLRDYASAIEFFNRSNETAGPHHITWHNAGICFFYLGDFDSALECFRACLELAPEYAEARLWWDRAALKQGTASGSAGAGSGGSAGEAATAGGGEGAAGPHAGAEQGGAKTAAGSSGTAAAAEGTADEDGAR